MATISNSRPVPNLRLRIREAGEGMLEWWAGHRRGFLGGSHRYCALIDWEDHCELEREAIDQILLSLLPVAGALDIREVPHPD